MRYTITTFGGTLQVSEPFKITYLCDASGACILWKLANPSPFSITLLHSPSGSGKTTFLGEIYKRLRGQPRQANSLSFDFRPDCDDVSTLSVAYIPQNPQMVAHWQIKEILPDTSKFLPCFFSGVEIPKFFNRRFGEFSGGQRRKIYACSALEQLAVRPTESNFILLDETFDGLGAQETVTCLNSICNAWLDYTGRSLYILLVTHLNYNELTQGGVTALHIGLEVLGLTDHELKVKIFN
jgi:ABC-type Mn2+/Zn2+ transport system ATPase subunit